MFWDEIVLRSVAAKAVAEAVDDSEGSDGGRSKNKRSSRNITEEEIAEYMAKKAKEGFFLSFL